MKIKFIKLLAILPVFAVYCGFSADKKWLITGNRSELIIKAGILERRILLTPSTAQLKMVTVDAVEVAGLSPEFSLTLRKASPDKMPRGISLQPEMAIEQKDAEKNQTDGLSVKKANLNHLAETKWIDSVTVTGNEKFFRKVDFLIISDRRKAVLTFSDPVDNQWEGVTVKVVYEIYQGFPVIRKWILIENKGNHWIKTDNLFIDQFRFTETFRKATPLTPGGRGTDPSVLAFSDPELSKGIIAASEIPSRIRELSVAGKTGYKSDFFEWVLGPGEAFETEPVFVYAFAGESFPTLSSVSTALDRCTESEFHKFLEKHILRQVNKSNDIAPLFCTWTNYNAAINGNNMREAAIVASKIGFRCFQLDAGWSQAGGTGGWAVSVPRPDTLKFPDLKDFNDFLFKKNMKPGLWYSVFIKESDDKTPEGQPVLFSLPQVKRAGGLGLSMCYAPSREKYADELISLNTKYGAAYFKQDLSDICYGDIAEGHESRTLKESYLRGIRGLFMTQDEIHRRVPDVWLQLSHEIYWETPGPPADVAVLKHADSYHISPNEYWGAGNRSRIVTPDWRFNPDSLRLKLIQGAFRARDFWYSHRGLPTDRLEVFAAATTNCKGSLTAAVQDRQVCSWLMGAPLSFSGDLGSLTPENIERYRKLLEIAGTLQQKYGIYSCFQFSGVPAPTDEGWHWWGKLNEKGCGAVVVLRGSSGESIRKINIPWVNSNAHYRIRFLLTGKQAGVFSGQKLQDGVIELNLPPLGQEIIEVKMI